MSQSSRSINYRRNGFLLLIATLVLSAMTVEGFCPPSPLTSGTKTRSALYSSSESNMEIIEFKIYPDGRVEETVRGVKGNNCHKVTEGINEMLGKVVATAPTEEMYEQEVVVETTLTESVSTNGNSNGNNSWEGSSSW